MADLKAEITEANYRLMVDMMGQAQEYQQAYTQEILKEFSAYLDRQRRQDLELMEVAFNQIIEQNDEQQKRIFSFYLDWCKESTKCPWAIPDPC